MIPFLILEIVAGVVVLIAFTLGLLAVFRGWAQRQDDQEPIREEFLGQLVRLERLGRECQGQLDGLERLGRECQGQLDSLGHLGRECQGQLDSLADLGRECQDRQDRQDPQG